MKFLFRTPGLPLVLIPSLVLSPIWAQVPLPIPNQASLAANLVLKVVESGAPQSSGSFSPSKRIAVQVRDENGAPVSDAAVAFRLPDAPLSGNFSDGSHSAVAYTDQSGVAHVDGIQWMASTGSVPVRITATKGNSHAGLMFEDKMSDAPAEAASSSAIRAVDAGLKPTPAPVAPVVPTPGVVAAEVARGESPAAPPVEIAVAATSPRPSVSISNLSRSGSVRANALRSDAEPSVSISNSGGYSNHSSLKKWLILGAVLAGGAGAAFAFSGRNGSSSSTTSTSTTTIGTPTINVGH